MKKKFILSLFEQYSFPEDFLKMPLDEIVFIHSQALGKPINKDSYDSLLKRADSLYERTSEKSIEVLISDAGISIDYLKSGIQLGSYLEFSYLVFEDKKIYLNSELIGKMKIACRGLFEEPMCECMANVFLAHEYCHYIDFSDKYLFESDVQREVFHELAAEIKALAAIEREICTPARDGCEPSEQVNCHVKGECSDETKEFCHGGTGNHHCRRNEMQE